MGSDGSLWSDIWGWITQSIADADCRRELVDIAPTGIALGLVLWTVTAISIIPSITKPIKLGSTEGMSAWTLLLTNVQQTFTVVNTTLMKSPQIAMCWEQPLGCQPTLISWWQTVSAWILLFFVFPTVVRYPFPDNEETKARNQKLWFYQWTSCFSLVGITTAWALNVDCPSSVATVGTLFGWGSSILMVFRFAPQLLTTCMLRTAGSISYVTYLVIGVGGFAMTFFQILVSQEHISTWFPVFVGNCFQTLIILTAATYDYGCLKRCKGTSVEDKQAEAAAAEGGAELLEKS